MQTGKLYVEYGHASEEDKADEKVIEKQRQDVKELCFDYNSTRPSDYKRKGELLDKILGSHDKGAQFSLPVVIKDHVWVGANVSIMPGVTIGENSVIGAGSVATHDIPANVVAMGVPCRPVREITDEDLLYIRKNVPLNCCRAG